MMPLPLAWVSKRRCVAACSCLRRWLLRLAGMLGCACRSAPSCCFCWGTPIRPASCRVAAATGIGAPGASGQSRKGHPMVSTAPKSARRWALSPVDSRSHLLAEQDGAPVGMLVADCGQLLTCSTDTIPYPTPGLRCPSCAPDTGQAQDRTLLSTTQRRRDSEVLGRSYGVRAA
jgi:hypothetical protein